MDTSYIAGRRYALEKLGFLPLLIANQVNKPAGQPAQPAAPQGGPGVGQQAVNAAGGLLGGVAHKLMSVGEKHRNDPWQGNI